MMYLTYISNTYAAKNAFEKSVLVYLLQLDRIMIAKADLKGLMESINIAISTLHKLNERCKPIKLKLYSSNPLAKDEVTDYVIEWNGFEGFNGHELCHFTFLQINDGFKPSKPVEVVV